MATHQTRDLAMERDNRFEAVLGATAASTFTKQESEKQNDKVVSQLKEFYDADILGNEDRYLEISLESKDDRLRETYAMLPEYTKEQVRKVWGGNKFYVRKDLLDITLGYRNLTTDQLINDAKARMDEMLGKQVTDALLGPKAAIRVRKVHDAVTHIMRVYKDFVVIRNATTLIDNIKSNAALLFMYQIPLKEIVRGHRRAFQGLKDYQRVNKDLQRLQVSIDSAGPGVDTVELELRASELEFQLQRNPVKTFDRSGYVSNDFR